MKTSFVSTSTMAYTLRYQLTRLQADLVDRQKESIEGRLADPGATLGAVAGRTLSMSRDVERLKGLIDANSMVESRLDATQEALTQIGTLAQDMLSTVTAAYTDVDQDSVIQLEAERILESVTGILNSNFNGEYLFAGINTDVKPLDDFSDPSSPSKAAFDAAFFAKFGFSQSDPAVSSISAADMEDFLTNHVEPQFLGTGWADNWSDASDEKITSRIALNETAESSVTANESGLRKLVMVAATLSDLLKSPLNDETRRVLYERTTSLASEAIAEITSVQANTGITQNRVTAANERLSLQADLYTGFINDLEGVEPAEAATRVNQLLTQIETSYALTARIQQLSLLNYL